MRRMGWFWLFLGYRRPIPAETRLHSCVRERAGFRQRYETRSAEGATWADPDWRTLHHSSIAKNPSGTPAPGATTL